MTDLPLRTPAYRASRRARPYWAVRALACWLVVGAVEAIVLLAAAPQRAVWTAVVGVSVLVAAMHLAVMPQWRYRVHRWEVTDTAVYTQAGWVNEERRIAPIARIQTVDTHRGPFEQVFGLANVTVTTASSRGPIKIHALDHPLASSLVDRLTQQAQLAGEDGT